MVSNQLPIPTSRLKELVIVPPALCLRATVRRDFPNYCRGRLGTKLYHSLVLLMFTSLALIFEIETPIANPQITSSSLNARSSSSLVSSFVKSTLSSVFVVKQHVVGTTSGKLWWNVEKTGIGVERSKSVFLC
jgi:hypothetical protein